MARTLSTRFNLTPSGELVEESAEQVDSEIYEEVPSAEVPAVTGASSRVTPLRPRPQEPETSHNSQIIHIPEERPQQVVTRSIEDSWDARSIKIKIRLGSGDLVVQVKALNWQRDDTKITFSYKTDDVSLAIPTATQIVVTLDDGNSIDAVYMLDLDLFPGRGIRTIALAEVKNPVD